MKNGLKIPYCLGKVPILELMDAAQTLLRYGALLGIVLGLFSTLFWLYTLIIRAFSPFFSLSLIDLFMFGMSLLAIILSYFVLNRIPQKIEDDPLRTALLIFILGVFIAIGSWGIAGLIIIISALFIFINETS